MRVIEIPEYMIPVDKIAYVREYDCGDLSIHMMNGESIVLLHDFNSVAIREFKEEFSSVSEFVR